MSRKLLATLLAALLGVLSACGGPTGSPTAPGETTTSTPEPVSHTLDSAPRDILELGSEALAQMDSFQLHLSFAYDGTDTENAAKKGEVELVNAYWRSAAKDRHLSISEQDLLNDDGMGTGLYQLGGKIYSYTRDDTRGLTCSRVITDTPSGAQELEFMLTTLQPNIFITGVKAARMTERGVQVNGVLTDHYVFDQVDFGSFSSVQGDLWLAQGNDPSEEFIVRYTGQAVGQTDLLAGAFSGTISWDYQIENINQVAEVQLPESCTTIRMDIPLPDQADVQVNSRRMLAFSSPQSIADLAAFLRSNLPTAGWTLESTTPNDTSWDLAFSQGSATLKVRIDQTRTGATVMINREESPDTSSVNDLPMPSSAVGAMAINGLRQFGSPESPATIAAFFTQQLPAEGWQQQSNQSGWGMYSLGFTRGPSWVWIDIMPDSQSGTQVMIRDDTSQ